jgi:hypothetical protein
LVPPAEQAAETEKKQKQKIPKQKRDQTLNNHRFLSLLATLSRLKAKRKSMILKFKLISQVYSPFHAGANMP